MINYFRICLQFDKQKFERKIRPNKMEAEAVVLLAALPAGNSRFRIPCLLSNVE